jgi:hypothetical protein
MIRSILAAAILSLGVVSVALAFAPSPATSPKLAVASDLVQVGHKGHKGGKWNSGKWHGNRHAYKHNYNVHRYKSAPHGWRHYSYRPYRWAFRGCVLIGPLWYCP